MNPKELITDDNGVSPVIGVILMVAITVILAAVIASFVLGLGDQAGQAAPQVSVTCSGGNMVHNGGDALEPGNPPLSFSSGDDINTSPSGSEITAGDQINDVDGALSSGDQLIWTDSDSGETQIIAEC